MIVSNYTFAYVLWQSVVGMNLSSLNNSEHGIARLINKNLGLCFVVVDRDQIVSRVLGATDSLKGYLYHVAVTKKYQGKHVGGQLLNQVITAFKHRDIHKIGLFVVTNNQDGQDFWKHQGFKLRSDINYFDMDLSTASTSGH